MINFTLAGVMLALSGVATLVLSMYIVADAIDDHRQVQKGACIAGSICATVLLILAAGLIKASGEYLPPKYYEITEVGKVDSPKQVAVVEGDLIDVTYNHNVVLYNPELYYLEVKEFKGCTRCLVSKLDRTEYRVVPKSLIEVQ
jgi:hypothetical protein